jgi:hypothetical protein
MTTERPDSWREGVKWLPDFHTDAPALALEP